MVEIILILNLLFVIVRGLYQPVLILIVNLLFVIIRGFWQPILISFLGSQDGYPGRPEDRYYPSYYADSLPRDKPPARRSTMDTYATMPTERALRNRSEDNPSYSDHNPSTYPPERRSAMERLRPGYPPAPPRPDTTIFAYRAEQPPEWEKKAVDQQQQKVTPIHGVYICIWL